VNAVARGDLAARLGSARGLRLQTIYLAICSAFLLLSLPPEIGRIDLRDANLLLALLAVQVVAVTYLTSAVSCTELALEGEKALPDLALSAFPPRMIAAGKAVSGALYAAYLLAIGLPVFVLAAALRGAPLAPIAWATLLSLSLATAAGTWGAWLSGRFASDFTRSFAHWSFLGVLLGATALLPAEWWPANPIRVVDVIVREGWTPWLLVAIAGYLSLAGAGLVLTRRYVEHSRSHGDGV
jgi:hypothetical protein